MTAMPVAYRLATAADALCVGVLAMQVYLDTYATEGIRPDIARDVLADYAPDAYALRLTRPDVRTVLAERAGHLVGFAEIRLQQRCPVSNIACTTELDRLYVQQPFHRQGIGAALLRQAEAIARQQATGGLWLTAWSGNANALDFYPRQGYRAVGTAQHWIEGIAYENVVFFKESA
ncbi:MAG: GNAT family N-acetyltransferase [Burkholderiales bacterium PBB5]|nr:MAG: GNAT family N-acetyltransferase [Burkholderiales bacterium PBB5]